MERGEWFTLAGLLLTVWANIIATLAYIQSKKKPQPKQHSKRKRKR